MKTNSALRRVLCLFNGGTNGSVPSVRLPRKHHSGVVSLCWYWLILAMACNFSNLHGQSPGNGVAVSGPVEISAPSGSEKEQVLTGLERRQAVNRVGKMIVISLILALFVCAIVFLIKTAGAGFIVMSIGVIGSLISIYRGVGDLSDQQIVALADSWWAIVAPSVVGGALALALYLLFLSSMIQGDLFPKFVSDPELTPTEGKPVTRANDIRALLRQSADSMPSYAKLCIWSFVAGYNQKYVVDILESFKPTG